MLFGYIDFKKLEIIQEAKGKNKRKTLYTHGKEGADVCPTSKIGDVG